jgi:CheY-like chemotaxis protein
MSTPEAAHLAAKKGEDVAMATGSGYLLIIDDSPTVQKVVELALSEVGHRVVAAPDGETALALVREARAVPALILLDGLIPGRDAADFCRQLTDHPTLARVPVVVMIARGQAADLEERFAKASNVVDTLAKPFSPETLQAVVARVVGLPPSAVGAAVAEALSLSAGPADAAVAEARAFAAAGQVLAGDLAVISLSQILELLAEQQHSGTLRVLNTETNARIEIFFRAGRVDFAAAVGVAEELLIGRFAVETGDVTAEALTRVIAERARGAGKLPLFGADLIARGLISPEALAMAMVRQTSELAYETLRWRAGFFQFRRGAEPPAAAAEARLQLNVDRMLLEAYRRVDEWRVIAREISDLDEVFVRNETKIGELPRGTLTREELGVLDEVDGRQSLREIVRKLRMGSFDVSKMFFRFRRARLIRKRVAPTST